MKSVWDYKKNLAHDSSKSSQFFRNYIHFWEYIMKNPRCFSLRHRSCIKIKTKTKQWNWCLRCCALTDSADSSLFFKDFLWKHIYLYPDHKEKPGQDSISHQCDCDHHHHHSFFIHDVFNCLICCNSRTIQTRVWMREKEKKSAQNAYSAFILYSQRRQKMQSKEQRRTITSLCRI